MVRRCRSIFGRSLGRPISPGASATKAKIKEARATLAEVNLRHDQDPARLRGDNAVLFPPSTSLALAKVVGEMNDHQPAFAFNPAASMPARAQISSLSEVSPLTPTAPSRPLSLMISTPPGTGIRRPCAIVFTASTK